MGDAQALCDIAIRFTGNVGESGVNAACVDLSAMEGADAAVLQVLTALDAEFQRRSWQLQVEGPAEAVEIQWRKAGWPGFSASR